MARSRISIRVYAQPVESPTHTSPLPPSDGRTLVVNPANSTASPFGWHDTNGAAGAEFTIDPRQQRPGLHRYRQQQLAGLGLQSERRHGAQLRFRDQSVGCAEHVSSGAVTNLFYWNNIIHDVQYQYGFDEAAGNFQVNNYGRGGAGNDSVQAEAQDGGGTNNANFATPADGSRPRMQMYVWTSPNLDRDGDLDAGIVVHEYGHGISNRLVGGPSNVNCLTNRQQPGEGLSDWWALAYTARAGDTERRLVAWEPMRWVKRPVVQAFALSVTAPTRPSTLDVREHQRHGGSTRRRLGVGAGGLGGVLEACRSMGLQRESLQRCGRLRQSAHDVVCERGLEEHGVQSDVHSSS